MKKMFGRNALMTMLITGCVFNGAVVSAEEVPAFDLDQMIVTATRYEKKDVDVPASTVVITHEQIKDKGATTAASALEKVNGFTAKAFGPLGASMGTMINEATIRGNDNGTLVLVNGSPVSWRGKYNLDAIPADSIDRIEMVKGSGSVLYGSEAMSGVINIITKKGANNSITAGFGSHGQQLYNVNVGTNKLGVNYSLEKFLHDVHVSDSSVNTDSSTKFTGTTKTVASDVKKENIGLNYSINNNLDVLYNYYETEANYERFVTDVLKTTSGIKVGDQFNGRLYTTEQHVAQVNYHDDLWRANAFFNTGTVESNGPTLINSKGEKTPKGWYNTKEKNRTYGLNVQRNWTMGEKSKAILGASFMDESYDAILTSTGRGNEYSRDVWGIYGQLEQKFNDKDTFILGARETFTRNAPGKQNYNNFSASGQILHKIDEENSVYGSVSQSFIMPTFAQMYGASDSAVPNPGLKPQTGLNYEAGWKKITGDHAWKAAIFYTTIKDNISASWDKKKTEYKYTNEDYENTGVELSCDIVGNGPWSYNYGITLQDPKSKSEAKGDYWDRKFGRYQLTGGVGYKVDKWRANISGSYLAGRVASPSKEHSYDMKPYFLTTFNTIYSPDKNSDITLTIDNLLNREDNLSHSGSNYYPTPCNFLLSYTYKF